MTVIETCKPSQVSSYIADDESGSIMFLPCGVISFDRNDVRERYCTKCRRFIMRNFELNILDGRSAGSKICAAK
jgi:hypothetical protein